MPRKKRVLIIIHLCLAFTYLFWIALHPFLKEVVVKKSETVLFENVIGNEASFATLEPSVQQKIKNGYEKLRARKEITSASETARKLPRIDDRKSVHISNIDRLTIVDPRGFGAVSDAEVIPLRAFNREHHGTYLDNFSVSFFGIIWMLLSIALSLFMLYNIEGAATACWLLPMVVLAYGYFIGTTPAVVRPDFFPTEEQLSPYFEKNSEKKQRQKLVEAWNSYLIAEKLHETPIEEKYEEQITRGNFLFNVERVKWLCEKKGGDVTLAASLFTPSAFQFILYIIWNFLFAWLMNRRSKSEVRLSMS